MRKTILFLLSCFAMSKALAYDVSAKVEMVSQEEWLFTIELSNNTVDFCGFQLDIQTDGTAEVSENTEFKGTILNEHIIAENKIQDRIRILGYSETNQNFKSKEGTILSFKVKGDFTKVFVDQILFSDNESKLETTTDLNLSVDNTPNSIDTLPYASKNTYDIYNIAGQKVKIGQRGIYIVNGKKVLK